MKTGISTEEKILQAARKVFHKKGYDAARMDDIAEEANINKAMLHYYFRSKDKLFNRVFMEALEKFLPRIIEILNSGGLTLEVKISRIVDHYTHFMIENRDIPVFVLSELRQRPERMVKLVTSHPGFTLAGFIEHINREVKTGEIRKVEPVQVFTHLLGLTVFPFIAEPMIKKVFNMNEKEFKEYLMSRRKEIPRLLMQYVNP